MTKMNILSDHMQSHVIVNTANSTTTATESTEQALQITPHSKTVAQGESITFRLAPTDTHILHQFWKFDEQQKGSGDTFELDTSGLKPNAYLLRVSVTAMVDGQRKVITIEAHFQIAAEFDDAKITVDVDEQDVVARCEFVGMESAFFSWLIDRPSGPPLTQRIIRNGQNIPVLQLNDLDSGNYRIRVEINNHISLRRLSENFSLESQTPEEPVIEAISPDEFIKETKNTFLKILENGGSKAKGKAQDEVHNCIINYLLETQFSRDSVVTTDPNKRAYDVLRDGKVNAPLLFIRAAQTVNDIEATTSLATTTMAEKYPALNTTNKKYLNSIFIRDFMNIYSQGNLTVKNWLVEDIAAQVGQSTFVAEFNAFVFDINEQIESGKQVKEFNHMAHRDAIQIISMPNSTGSDRYAGAMMSNVHITENIITSVGMLQGIFASDGAFKALHINNNHLNVSGAHNITINGMLSGDLSGNTDINGFALAPEKIKLLPLRIGGGANIYIVGFSNKASTPDEKHYEYEDIAGVPQHRDFRQHMGWINPNILDPNHESYDTLRFYDQVDMEEFHKAYASKKTDIETQGRPAAAYRSLMETLSANGHARRIS